MTAEQERVFEHKAEQYFKGHRSPGNGRNFLAFVERFHGGDVQKNFDIGHCRTFPQARGNRLCGACYWTGDCPIFRGEEA